MYCVRGEGSSSYLSKGRFSITRGSDGWQENWTTGCAVRGGFRLRTENEKQNFKSQEIIPNHIMSTVKKIPKQMENSYMKQKITADHPLLIS